MNKKIPDDRLIQIMRFYLYEKNLVLTDLARVCGVNYNTLWYAIHERGQFLVTESEFAQIRANLGGKELRRKYPRYKRNDT